MFQYRKIISSAAMVAADTVRTEYEELFDIIHYNPSATAKLGKQLESNDEEKIAGQLGINCNGSTEHPLTNFMFYAPHKKGRQVSLRLWVPTDNKGNYRLKQDYKMEQKGDYFYLALEHARGSYNGTRGCCYQVIDDAGDITTTPWDEFMPAGYKGNVAEIIDHRKFVFSEKAIATLKKNLYMRKIKKLHVGTATKEGTFKALTETAKKIRVKEEHLQKIKGMSASVAPQLLSYLRSHRYLSKDNKILFKFKNLLQHNNDKLFADLLGFYNEYKISPEVSTANEFAEAVTGVLNESLEAARLLDYDSVELFPINEYSGKSKNKATFDLANGHMNISSNGPVINGWGYDYIGYILSVNANYGTPYEFKELVATLLELGISTGIDGQYNHIGPNGNRAQSFFPIIGPFKLEWGDVFNYAHNMVRHFTTTGYEKLLELYGIAFGRLDQTFQYYRENIHIGDGMVFALGRVKPTFRLFNGIRTILFHRDHVPTIAEDSRAHMSQTDASQPVKKARTTIDATWDTDFVKVVKNIIGRLSTGQQLPAEECAMDSLATFIMDKEHSVLYDESHDEQGNENGFRRINHMIKALLSMARGPVMDFDHNYFHFFRDSYGEVLEDMSLLAQKCGAVTLFEPQHWDYIKTHHPEIIAGFNTFWETAKGDFPHLSKIENFNDLASFKSFIWYFHGRFYKDVKNDAYHGETYGNQCKALERDITGLNSERKQLYTSLFETYNRMIKDISADKGFNPRPEALRLQDDIAREWSHRYQWLGPIDSPKDTAIRNNGEHTICIVRANPVCPEKEQLAVACNFDLQYKRKIVLPISAGTYTLTRTIWDKPNNKYSIKQETLTATDKTEIEMDPLESVMMERINEEKIPARDWSPFFSSFMPRKESIEPQQPTAELSDKAEDFVKNGENQKKAGFFLYKGRKIYFGFKGDNFYLFANKYVPKTMRIHTLNAAGNRTPYNIALETIKRKDSTKIFKFGLKTDVYQISSANARSMTLEFENGIGIPIAIPG